MHVRTDQKRLGEEIDKIRSGLKVKVASLREMQGQCYMVVLSAAGCITIL